MSSIKDFLSLHGHVLFNCILVKKSNHLQLHYISYSKSFISNNPSALSGYKSPAIMKDIKIPLCQIRMNVSIF